MPFFCSSDRQGMIFNHQAIHMANSLTPSTFRKLEGGSRRSTGRSKRSLCVHQIGAPCISINAFTRASEAGAIWPLGDMLGCTCGGGPLGRGGVFPGLQGPSRPVADKVSVYGHRFVHAVALEGDASTRGSTKNLRFEFLRFRAGGRNMEAAASKL